MKQKRTLSVLAVILILIGLVITLENFNVIDGLSSHWPIFLLILGTGFSLLFTQKKDPVMMWLGSLFVFLGLFFYYLNYNSWYSLAVLWPVFLGIIGISFILSGLFTQNKILGFIGSSLVGLFLAFYLVFTISLKLWPMSLVVFGLSLLIIDYFNKKK
ncbi:MAG: hypothetical protein V3V78_05415 [Candidatus Woesearchaeota archaeon]